MPQLAPFTVIDRKTTPADHVFTPRGITRDGKAELVESTGSPIGDLVYSIHPRRTPNGRFKIDLELMIPVTGNETINGVTRTVILRRSFHKSSHTFEPTSTRAERNDAIGIWANAYGVSNTLVDKVLNDLESVY